MTALADWLWEWQWHRTCFSVCLCYSINVKAGHASNECVNITLEYAGIFIVISISLPYPEQFTLPMVAFFVCCEHHIGKAFCPEATEPFCSSTCLQSCFLNEHGMPIVGSLGSSPVWPCHMHGPWIYVKGSLSPGWSLWTCTIAFLQSCPQPYLLMLMTEAPRWVLDLIDVFTVLGTVGRLRYHQPALFSFLAEVRSLGTVQRGTWSRPKISPWKFLHNGLLLGSSSLSLRILPCGDLESEAVGILMSEKLSSLF